MGPMLHSLLNESSLPIGRSVAASTITNCLEVLDARSSSLAPVNCPKLLHTLRKPIQPLMDPDLMLLVCREPLQ